MADKPARPEDPTPAPEVRLTPDQFEALIRCVPKKHGGVRLRDVGKARVEIDVLDAEGNIMKSQLLPASGQQGSPSTSRRFVKERDRGEQSP